jgi:hypothetical protein
MKRGFMLEDITDLIPFMGMAVPIAIVWIVYYFDCRAKDQFHATLQKLIGSGQELTPELLESVPGYKAGGKRHQRDDIRSGVIVSGVGAGIAVFGSVGVGEEELAGIGLLVLCIGMSFLAYGIYTRKNSKSKQLP